MPFNYRSDQIEIQHESTQKIVGIRFVPTVRCNDRNIVPSLVFTRDCKVRFLQFGLENPLGPDDVELHQMNLCMSQPTKNPNCTKNVVLLSKMFGL